MRRKNDFSITELLKQSGYSEETIHAILQYYGHPKTAKPPQRIKIDTFPTRFFEKQHTRH